MIAPRWRKVFSDIAERPGRSLLAVIAMAAGVFALSALVFKWSILSPVLTTMYGKTLPSSATLFIASADDSLAERARHVPGVGNAEVRPIVLARARAANGEWMPVILFVIRDFDRQSMDLFRHDSGAWPPGRGDVLLERSAVAVAGIAPGGILALQIPGGAERSLRFTGTVHAAGLAPAWMEHVVYGFVPWTSVVRDGEHRESMQLRIQVAEHPLDEGHIREVSERVKAELESAGCLVTRVDVPAPGRHPHADQMDTFLYLLGAFGVLCFLLSSLLVASMIHALIAEQVRQVGIMKAIGGTTSQIAGIYLGQVAVLSAGALAIGIPPGLLVGTAYARFSAGILNADVTRAPFPALALAAVAIAGLLVPLLAALGPVRRAARITVHEALNEDLGSRPFGTRRFDRWLTNFEAIPRPLRLALRTAFLRRGRLALTVVMLAIGGALFTSALNVSQAWQRAITDDFNRRHFDLSVRLASPVAVATLEQALSKLPAVKHAEYWPQASPYLIGPSGVPGNLVALLGVDPTSTLLDLRRLGGRWLQSGDSNAAVINNAVLVRHPGLGIGDTVRVRLEGRTLGFPIAGIVKEMSPMPVIYAPAATVRAASGQSSETARSIRIVTADHSEAGQLAAAREIEQSFEEREIEISGLQRMLDLRKGILDHLVIIQTILTMAATLVVFVGSLGLASTLSIGVIQRTREIGVMGAIGATPGTIARQVWIESIVLGFLSWLLSLALAAPVSFVLESVTGQMFFKAPLEFFLSPAAAALWLALVLVLATLSSWAPARRAARLSVRDAIAHT